MYIWCTSIIRRSCEQLNTLKTHEATGPDGISPRLLAAAGTSIAGPLTKLYLNSLREAKVYDDWKVERLNPICKKYDEPDIGNYRPLSMLSVPSKILESCVTDSVVDHVFTRNQLVAEYQWAYRKGHSTDLHFSGNSLFHYLSASLSLAVTLVT